MSNRNEGEEHHLRSIEEIAEIYEATKQGGYYMALCPAHADGNPSLSIREGEHGILLHCFAGCDTRSVLEAMGLTFADICSGSNGDGYSIAGPQSQAHSALKLNSGFRLFQPQRRPMLFRGWHDVSRCLCVERMAANGCEHAPIKQLNIHPASQQDRCDFKNFARRCG